MFRKGHKEDKIVGKLSLTLSKEQQFSLAVVAQWIERWPVKGHQFNSQSGHMSGLWARSLAGGVREATE